jgi:hypothetical protein
MRGHIIPHWNSQQISYIDYAKQENIYRGFQAVESGYKELAVSMDIHQGLHPVLDSLKFEDYFNWLDSKMYAIHCMHPGCALPEHSDKYPYYTKTYGVSDIDNIQRIIVFLEDKQPGHRFTLEGVDIEHWRAGDWVSWNGATTHGAYNEGVSKRYTLQITGVIRGLNPK